MPYGGCLSKRLVVQMSKWKPDAETWIKAFSFLDEESQEKISSFHYQRDAKSCMIGRVLSRLILCEHYNTGSKNVLIGYTSRGRPYNLDPGANIDFNVSHHGDIVAFGTVMAPYKIGVDVMCIESPRNRTVPQFISNFKGQFSTTEFNFIESGETEYGCLKNFYRLWCLKESVIKALGTGLGFSLSRLNFTLHCNEISPGVYTTTEVSIDSIKDKRFRFEESVINDGYCLAVGILDEESNFSNYECPGLFEVVEFSSVVKLLDKYGKSNETYANFEAHWNQYSHKPFSQFMKNDPAL